MSVSSVFPLESTGRARHIKPGNFFLRSDGQGVLLDLG